MFLVANGKVLEAWQFKLPPAGSTITACNGDDKHLALDLSATQNREHEVPSYGDLPTNLPSLRSGNVRSYLLHLDARLREQTRRERYRAQYDGTIPRTRMDAQGIQHMCERFARYAKKADDAIRSRRDEQCRIALEQHQEFMSRTTSKLTAKNRHLLGRNWAVVRKKRARFGGVLTRRGSGFHLKHMAAKYKRLKKRDGYGPRCVWKGKNRNSTLPASSTLSSISSHPAVDVARAQASEADGGQQPLPQFQLSSAPKMKTSRSSAFNTKTSHLTLLELPKRCRSSRSFPSVAVSAGRASAMVTTAKTTSEFDERRHPPGTSSLPLRSNVDCSPLVQPLLGHGSTWTRATKDVSTNDSRRTRGTHPEIPMYGTALAEVGEDRPSERPSVLVARPSSKEACRRKVSIASLEDVKLLDILSSHIKKTSLRVGPREALQEATPEQLLRDDVGNKTENAINPLNFSTIDADGSIFAMLQEQPDFLEAGWGTAFFISSL